MRAARLVAAIGLGVVGLGVIGAAASVAADTIRIPAGPFVMGSNDGPADERPAHTVTLGAFEIDRLPVTNAEFARFLNAHGPLDVRGARRFDFDDPDARIRRVDGRYTADDGYADHPVVEASWIGARDYCRSQGKRLPTEAEWERAAKGVTGRTYPWGNEPPNATRAHFAGRYNDTRPVGSWPNGATPDGVHDLAGNVHEWTASRYLAYPYRADATREDEEHAGERVTRGGAHDSSADSLRSSWRGKGVSRAPASGHHNIGFRCVADAR